MTSFGWRKTGIVLLALALGVLLYQAIAPRLAPLPVYMSLPALSLTDQDGRRFDLDAMRGKVVLVSPIYTHCPDICPLTTAKIREIQNRLASAGLSDQVQLLSVSVDPQRDTSKVLKNFAQTYRADLANWAFLTGAPGEINQLVQSLDIYVERVYYVQGTLVPENAYPNPPPGQPYLVNHTDRIFLADRQGRVRILLPGSQSDVDEAVRKIRQLIDLKDGE